MAAAQARSRAEQLAAASGRTQGADLAQMQGVQANQNAQARQQAAQTINAADLLKQRQQKGEIEARLAEKSRMAANDIEQIGTPAANLAAAGGAATADALTPPLEGQFTPEQLAQIKAMLGLA